MRSQKIIAGPLLEAKIFGMRLKKNQSTPRPSEDPPVIGGKNWECVLVCEGSTLFCFHYSKAPSLDLRLVTCVPCVVLAAVFIAVYRAVLCIILVSM